MELTTGDMIVIEIEDKLGVSSERRLVSVKEESYTDNSRRVITVRER